jgi:DNA-binding NarL/FixJ family response regulator
MSTAVKRARLLLADDHAAILAQAVRLLECQFEIAGNAGNGLETVEAAVRLDPDVLVLDITLPGIDGIEVAHRLRHAGCRTKLVFLTVHEDPDYVRAALEAGGVAYVAKARLATDLLPAIHSALAGELFVSPTLQPEDKS